MAELKATIDDQKSGNRAQALAGVQTNRGRDLMDEARGLFLRSFSRKSRIASTLRWLTSTTASWSFSGSPSAAPWSFLLVVGGSVWSGPALHPTAGRSAAAGPGAQCHARAARAPTTPPPISVAPTRRSQRFAYIVTHDLRAPLVNIMGFTSELEGCLTAIQGLREAIRRREPGRRPVQAARTAALEDLPEAIGFIRSSTRKMDGLINAILKLSREGRRVLKPERIQLDALLRNRGRQSPASGGRGRRRCGDREPCAAAGVGPAGARGADLRREACSKTR